MIPLKLSRKAVLARLRCIQRPLYQRGLAKHWRVVDDPETGLPCAPPPSVAWLYCWGDTGGPGRESPSREAIAAQARAAFNNILERSFESLPRTLKRDGGDGMRTRFRYRPDSEVLRQEWRRLVPPASGPSP